MKSNSSQHPPHKARSGGAPSLNPDPLMGGLCLSRKAGERILIGDDIIVTVVEIRGEKVRIRIRAPDGVSIHREEVYRLVQREREAAQ